MTVLSVIEIPHRTRGRCRHRKKSRQVKLHPRSSVATSPGLGKAVGASDSVTVAPNQKLTDKEFQLMPNQSSAVILGVGVETDGSNIQFGVNPNNDSMVITEMNPRVSRSCALPSNANRSHIAKLAVGYLLNEIRNDITRETPATFESTIVYVVVKVPRFAFGQFSQDDPTLNAQMKSVGEAMRIGRTFMESRQECLR